MALKDDLTTLISDPASGIENPVFELEEAPGDKVSGFIISPTFAGKTQIERQNMVWDYLDNNLDKEQILRIVSLVTVTPDEAKDD
ncbi:MAG: BolA family protein [Planctomycetota bacterium]|jgi:acid stress-induced BolA-like protein IbaG/YrbA